MTEREPTRLYQYLEDRLNGLNLEKAKSLLAIARNPPYFEGVEPDLIAYVATIRPLQDLVREKINLKLKLTETDGAPYSRLFDTDHHAVEQEFANWGLINAHENLWFCNTGHRWVMVDSAKFKQTYLQEEKAALKKMQELERKLTERYKPIQYFREKLEKYENEMITMMLICLNQKASIEEKKRFDEVKEKFLARSNLVTKGILSLSMVESLIYKAEQSLDLAQHHPGD